MKIKYLITSREEIETKEKLIQSLESREGEKRGIEKIR